MLISLMDKEQITSIALPDKIRGQYSLVSSKGFRPEIEGIDGKWMLKPGSKLKFADPAMAHNYSCEIQNMATYLLESKDKADTLFIFAEPSTNDRIEFKKFIVNNEIQLSIGRKPGNDIFINNPYVSSIHARMLLKAGTWYVRDESSSNGTYVNGKKIIETSLNIGDIIYIMGTIIIVGKNMFAINNPDGTVTINNPFVAPFASQDIKEIPEDEKFDFDSLPDETFYRSPRFKRDVETARFKLDAPPSNQNADETPFMLTLGPSMTMGMASVATAIYGVANGNMMSAITSSFMLLGTVMWPIISKNYEKKRKRKKEEQRQITYKEYLSRVASSFEHEAKKQKEILDENSISIKECTDRIKHINRKLWERSYGQNDFLDIAVGTGDVGIAADIQFPERKFEIERDGLEEKLLEICEAPHVIKDAPINVSFFKNNVSGIIGERDNVLAFTNGLILQLATLYSYDEVKLVFIYDETKENEQLSYVKWLPHIWNNDKSVRFLAKNTEDGKKLSAILEAEFTARSEMNDDDLDEVEPYYIIFTFDKKLSLRADILQSIYDSKKNLHFSVINVFNELKELPKECSNVIELESPNGRIFDKNDMSGKVTSFRQNICIREGLEEYSKLLANIHLDIGDNAYVMPKMITFLEMYNVGKIEHLNILNRWKENDPTKTLEATVGVDTVGDAFKLDLHEKYHGPHGLVAGMTGSGKSEFIMTYILSLAINYHPNEVAFVLIDYKGGGMAKAFENLPHTAGIITNLDGASINRSLTSIQSELRRRQAIFAKASKISGTSNVDIYKYQKMYREGSVKEPLQHLFIISDEFAELKTQQPEFMSQLVSAARIGRSLGVHLILATQKPSGVVDDQIWSNSKFKACLKVQDKADSMDMLKRPEAAELKDTGRFYLQIGYNEMFKMGQSAWSGAPYYATDKVEANVDDSVEVVDNIGRVLEAVKMDKKKSFGKPKKQIDAITEYLADLAEQENIKVRPLWLEPIPDKIYVDKLAEKYNYVKKPFVLNPVIGEFDDPMNQRQDLLTLPLTEGGNVAVYGMTGGGKTTFLTTLIYSLISTYTPEELSLYIMDFSSETLTAFSKAPHVGDVVLAHEQEKVVNLIKLLLGQIQTRKKLFSNFGGDINLYNSEASKKVPNIVVVVNNYAAFNEMYDDYEGEMLKLTREGTKFGIYFVLTATNTNAIRFRMQQNISQLFALQMADDSDYNNIIGKTGGLLPAKIKARGICKLDEVYEFQTAHAFEAENQFVEIRKYCETLKQKYPDAKAKKIPVLPENVDFDFIEAYAEEGSLKIPVGVETESLELRKIDLNKQYVTMVLSAGKNHFNFISAMTEIMLKKSNLPVTVFDADGQMTKYSDATYLTTKKQLSDGIDELFDIVLNRHNATKDAETAGDPIPVFDCRVVVIASLIALRNQLDDQQKEKIGLILEKGKTKLNIHVIIGETSKSIPSMSFEKWYMGNVSQNDGVWVGNGFSDQYFIKATKVIGDGSGEMADRYGYLVENGKAVKTKLINFEEVE